MIIRPESTSDYEAIRVVHLEAFNGPAEARLVDILRVHGKALISLVAELENRVIGHILFSPVTIEPESGRSRGLGLAPVGVLPEHQGRGAGSILIKQGLALARQNDFDYVVVLGDPEYYQRFGFQPASRYGLESEYNAGDAFMALALKPGALEAIRGMVYYAPEFNEEQV
jgi:putative acetyltransferase